MNFALKKEEEKNLSQLLLKWALSMSNCIYNLFKHLIIVSPTFGYIIFLFSAISPLSPQSTWPPLSLSLKQHNPNNTYLHAELKWVFVHLAVHKNIFNNIFPLPCIWKEMYRRGKGQKSGTNILTSPCFPDLPKLSLRLKMVSMATLHPSLYE